MTVLTLTLNPSLDISTSVDRVQSNAKLRCEQESVEPGGGGINVSTAMQELGAASTALCPCGGCNGNALENLLKERDIPHQLIRIEVETRANITIADQSSGEQYRFVLPGPRLSEEEVERCLQAVADYDPHPDYLVVSGSYPPGVSVDFIPRLIDRMGSEAKLIVDTSGKALRRAADEGVFLLKPNLRELQHLTDIDTATEEGQETAVRELVQESCHAVVLSLGAAGVLFASPDGLQRFRAPTVSIQSRVGAGDSMVAGIMAALTRDTTLAQAVQYGVAAGTAAVMTPGTQLCRKDDVESLYSRIASREC